jgi:hypothetical protein
MSDDNTRESNNSPLDQGRAGWDQVSKQDELHWSDQRPSEDQHPSVPDNEDHGRNENLNQAPRDDDGFADYQARKDDNTPDTNWDQDDYRRTEFAGSLDGTSHPSTPPDVNGEPPHLLRPD